MPSLGQASHHADRSASIPCLMPLIGQRAENSGRSAGDVPTHGQAGTVFSTRRCTRCAAKSFRTELLLLERSRGSHKQFNLASRTWTKWRAFKQVRKDGLRGWFQAWRAWKNYDRQHREHQRRCKQARRAKLLEAMREAQTCACKQDSRGLYQVVKRLAPKQTHRRLQLRDDRGFMLTPVEEADLLMQLPASFFKLTHLLGQTQAPVRGLRLSKAHGPSSHGHSLMP